MADSGILLISNIPIIKAVWKILKKVLLTISTFFQIEQIENFIAISKGSTWRLSETRINNQQVWGILAVYTDHQLTLHPSLIHSE